MPAAICKSNGHHCQLQFYMVTQKTETQILDLTPAYVGTLSSCVQFIHDMKQWPVHLASYKNLLWLTPYGSPKQQHFTSLFYSIGTTHIPQEGQKVLDTHFHSFPCDLEWSWAAPSWIEYGGTWDYGRQTMRMK